MKRFLVHHTHGEEDCAATFAAWRGFPSPLRGQAAIGSCRFGGHELWWEVEAETEADAIALFPGYIAARSTFTEIAAVAIR